MEPTEPTEISLDLPPLPESVAAARRALDELEDAVPAERLENLRLLVSELVTNAVRHAGLAEKDEISLRVTVSEETVGVEVKDPGVGFAPSLLEGPHPENGSGWGLPIVEKVSDRWEARREDGETRVWFELDL
jgi:anti-sigma regulatory factor (Ser/Thr protein kinase)